MRVEEDRINRNLVTALENAYTTAEFYRRSMAEAEEAGAAACRACYEDLLADAEKAVDRIKGLIRGHVQQGRW